MTATSITPVADNPTLTAEEIGKRFLKLIEGLESRSDLSVERIREVTGVSLEPEPGSLGVVYWSDDIEDGWRYSLTYIQQSPSLLRGISLDFSRPGERFTPMPAALCALDFDYYHNALEAMGFRAVEIRGEIGQLVFWRYYKEDITLSILPQNIVPGEVGRLCVKSIGTLN